MRINVSNCSSTSVINDPTQVALIEWLEAISTFKASYVMLSKNAIQFVGNSRSTNYFTQCSRSHLNPLLDIMCQELCNLTYQTNESINSSFLIVHARRLQQLTNQANQLISVMNQPMS